MSVKEHKRENHAVNCMILTISDTRTLETDMSGGLIEEQLKANGHWISVRDIIKDDRNDIQKIVTRACANPGVEVIICNGGTGIADRDVTIEAIKELFTKEIPGFGEIFRMLSYKEDIGSAAILSRAVAGTRNQTVIFALPGSTGAVKLAMEKLIIPELSHIIHELRKESPH